MAKPLTKVLKAMVFMFLLAITLSCANAARILDDVDPQDPSIVGPPTTTLPGGQIPAATVAPPVPVDDEADPPIPEIEVPPMVAPPVDDVAAPVADVAPPVDDVAAPVADVAPPVDDVAAPVADVAPVTPPVTVTAPIPGPITTAVAAPSATVAKPGGSPLSFFMHDVLGGSHPSARVVTGLIARTDINGIPFSVPNNNFFPLQGGTPLVNINNINSLINPNTAPLLTGLSGTQTSTVLQNTGNNNNVVSGNNQPFVTAGQLPATSALQKLMFGSITVVDDELTEGHELGSAVLGKAQGFYLVSSLDGTSHTLALTLLLHGNEDHGIEDTISIFGVHRSASQESQVAVIGGTGKYENARGYATVEILHQVDQHTTDGVDTITHFNVYLSE